MSKSYNPDRWVVLDFGDGLFKVLGGWYGGYLDSDHWRLNSGIVSINKGIDDNGSEWFEFVGHSGSTYKCYVDFEGLTSLTSSILDSWKNKHDIEIIEFEGNVPENMLTLCSL